MRGIDDEKEVNYLVEFLVKIFSLLKFSLRDIEKYFIRLDLILNSLRERDVLLVEPCLVLNALAMKSLTDFDNYINLKQEGIAKEIDKFLPLWKGLFYKSYKQEILNCRNQTSISAQTLLSNVCTLQEFLYNTVSNNIDEQEIYLQNYPQKIKFINNFSLFD